MNKLEDPKNKQETKSNINQISYLFLTLYIDCSFKKSTTSHLFPVNSQPKFDLLHIPLRPKPNLLHHREGLWAGCQHMGKEATLCLIQIPRVARWGPTDGREHCRNDLYIVETCQNVLI